MIFLLLATIALVALHIPRTVPVPGLQTRRQRGATIAGIAFVLAGALHFIAPEQYQPMMPPALPFPLALIYVSGVSEMLGGVGLVVPRTRRWAAWGLIALLIAVFPANVYVAYAEMQMPAFPHAPSWAYWARLPFQAIFIAWVAWAGGLWPKATQP